MTNSFSDYFGATAESYADHRPQYPAPLFQWLAGLVPHAKRVWDCGAGSGQAAQGLARHFPEVVATDPSVAQLSHAPPASTILLAAMTAEHAALADQSIDLVTVAQALHWFDRSAFYREVARVLRPGGIVAAWSYGLIGVGQDVDPSVTHFYRETVGPYWPGERAQVDRGYVGIEFPFREEMPPAFEMTAEWTLPMFAGYVSTWSAVTRYRAARGKDPVPELIRQLAPHWTEGRRRIVRWPLVVRAGRR